MNSSETSAKYSWPRSEQKEAIQDSGGPEEVDIMTLMQLAGRLGERNAALVNLGAKGRADMQSFHSSGAGCAKRRSASNEPKCPRIVVQVGTTSCPGAKSLKGRSLSLRIRSHGRGRGVVAQAISGAEHYLQARVEAAENAEMAVCDIV